MFDLGPSFYLVMDSNCTTLTDWSYRLGLNIWISQNEVVKWLWLFYYSKKLRKRPRRRLLHVSSFLKFFFANAGRMNVFFAVPGLHVAILIFLFLPLFYHWRGWHDVLGFMVIWSLVKLLLVCFFSISILPLKRFEWRCVYDILDCTQIDACHLMHLTQFWHPYVF